MQFLRALGVSILGLVIFLGTVAISLLTGAAFGWLFLGEAGAVVGLLIGFAAGIMCLGWLMERYDWLNPDVF